MRLQHNIRQLLCSLGNEANLSRDAGQLRAGNVTGLPAALPGVARALCRG